MTGITFCETLLKVHLISVYGFSLSLPVPLFTSFLSHLATVYHPGIVFSPSFLHHELFTYFFFAFQAISGLSCHFISIALSRSFQMSLSRFRCAEASLRCLYPYPILRPSSLFTHLALCGSVSVYSFSALSPNGRLRLRFLDEVETVGYHSKNSAILLFY